MKKSFTLLSVAIFALIATILTCCSAASGAEGFYQDPAESATGSDDLETGFRNPPHSAGVCCFWWWLNSNVTKDAITRDLEEMKDKGFSGALIFDANGSDHQGNRRVPAGPVFGGPEWTKLFVHACKEAKRLDFELSLNIQSGWNLGGPKVTAEEATQQLVWSKTEVKGPASIEQVLELPVKAEEFYRDVAVIAANVTGATTNHPIKNLHLKNASREFGMSAPDCRFLLETDPALPGEVAVKSKDIIDLTAKMDKNSMLGWDVPKGDWVVIRFGHTAAGAHVSTQSAGGGGRVLDYLNRKFLRPVGNSRATKIVQCATINSCFLLQKSKVTDRLRRILAVRVDYREIRLLWLTPIFVLWGSQDNPPLIIKL